MKARKELSVIKLPQSGSLVLCECGGVFWSGGKGFVGGTEGVSGEWGAN